MTPSYHGGHWLNLEARILQCGWRDPPFGSKPQDVRSNRKREATCDIHRLSKHPEVVSWILSLSGQYQEHSRLENLLVMIFLHIFLQRWILVEAFTIHLTMITYLELLTNPLSESLSFFVCSRELVKLKKKTL